MKEVSRREAMTRLVTGGAGPRASESRGRGYSISVRTGNRGDSGADARHSAGAGGTRVPWAAPAEALAVRPGQAQGPVRKAHPLALGEQLRRLGQGAQRRRAAARRDVKGEGPPGLRLRRPEARGAAPHGLGRPARALLREPRRRRQAGRRSPRRRQAVVRKFRAVGGRVQEDRRRRSAAARAGRCSPTTSTRARCTTTGLGITCTTRRRARPLLVLDMYEHAYHMDYGAAAAKYVDAFMQNVNWEEVNRRFVGARKMAALI